MSSMNGTSSSSNGTMERKEQTAEDVQRGYEEIMGIHNNNSNDSSQHPQTTALDARTAATKALSRRLMLFRKWLSEEAHATVHPAVAIVNGEATDGTRNAPVLALALPTSPMVETSTGSSTGNNGALGGAGADLKNGGASAGGTSNNNNSKAPTMPTPIPISASAVGGRIGSVAATAGDEALWDRTMGCQVRAVREIRRDEILLEMPRCSMLTPDVVACSDAGRAVLACCEQEAQGNGEGPPNFWDAFTNTTNCQTKFNPKISRNSGPQLLVKILQERKKAEQVYSKYYVGGNSGGNNSESGEVQLAERGRVSTRAPVLAFLIQQRFSNQERPAVVSESASVAQQFRAAKEEQGPAGNNGLQGIISESDNNNYKLQSGTPDTFAPYARTLPASVSLPICWRRADLALMAGCIPGIAFLQEVAARTMQLADEFIALVQAGILDRFPAIFPPGLITWERWVWAASISASRVLPASVYLDEGVAAEAFAPPNPAEFQSPYYIWKELGVMLPLLDMLNHESEAHQVTWKPCVPEKSNNSHDNDNGSDNSSEAEQPHPPRAIVHKKVRKGAEIYCAYGNLSNHNLVLQYGMAQMNNPSDEVKIGWGLSESVGNVPTPADFTPPVPLEETYGVYDCTDKVALDAWWTPERLQLLQREAFPPPSGEKLVESLKQGKKLSATAFSDGAYHPVLITAALVATMPEAQVRQFLDGDSRVIVIYQKHLGILRNFLSYSFSRKLEKLLQNLATGLKAHYEDLTLWTKSSKSGIRYQAGSATKSDGNGNDNGNGAGGGEQEGWQTFFDTHAYRSTMEVEKRYYAMGPECCVLTLYDGQLRALQSSLDGVVDDEKFKSGLQSQFVDLGFQISDKEPPEPDASEQQKGDKKEENDAAMEDSKPAGSNSPSNSSANDKKSSPSRRKRNRKKSTTTITNSAIVGTRPPALKLHVGNLSYSTTPSDLYDFFSTIYGKDNILECHIPLERETGRSRGFGFVTMPENAAQRALSSGKKHEIDGRLLKVARSNSAGTSESGKARPGPAPPVNDRCNTCGYGPRYCYCATNGPPRGGFPPGPPMPPPPGPPGPPMGPPQMMPPGPGPDRDHRHYGSHDGYRDDRYRDDYRGRGDDYYGRHRDRERGRDRDRDRDRERRYARSPPRGEGGGYPDYPDYDREDRYRSKRRRSRDRSPRSHSSSRRSRDYDDHNSSSRSSRRDSRRSADDDERDQGRKRSRSRSRSPRSRSRSRSRSPRERSRKKKSKKREL